MQRIASYIFPVRIWKGSGTVNPVLELFFKRGEWQLTTYDAVYSDGTRYKPMRIAFSRIEHELSSMRKVLVLGSGLGSAVQIILQKGYNPFFTLVDNDEKVLALATWVLRPYRIEDLKKIHADAETFMVENSSLYDLIIIDVFKGREVPGFVSTERFMQKCRSSLTTNGIIVLNYMINSGRNRDDFNFIKDHLLPGSELIDMGINKVLISKLG